ncbi:hypothetical protein [Salinibius halmophilus]|nr:hypothetical protein [Salinibius halmophilus]
MEHKKETSQFAVATINAKLQPMHRGEIYDDPLSDLLTATNRATTEVA